MRKTDFYVKPHKHEYIIIRRGGYYSQHAHIPKLQTCNLLLNLIEHNKLPHNDYLKGSCRRLLTEDEYLSLKEKKPTYYNSQKGIRGK